MRLPSVVGRLVGLLALSWLLAGCAGLATQDLRQRLATLADQSPSPGAFAFCRGYGCQERLRLALSPADWREVTAALRGPPADAAAERRALASAAQRFERAAGRLAGTRGDLGGTFAGAFRTGQLDCVDETANTLQLLRMLQAEGLLRRHRIGLPVHRGNLIDRWPHVSATLVERGSGRCWVLDPWQRDAGRQPQVLPVAAWTGDPVDAGACGP
jgi:hypothetical protein